MALTTPHFAGSITFFDRRIPMFDCEAQRFPKGVLPLRSNPSVPLCLVSATPERLTVVAPGRRGSSQNVKMHHSGLFNSIASKPATNHLYPFIAKYRYSNVRQVLSENGEPGKPHGLSSSPRTKTAIIPHVLVKPT